MSVDRTIRTLTADLSDAHENAYVVPRQFISYGASEECLGPIETVSTDNDNSLVSEALKGSGDGRILLVENAGSAECSMVGGDLARAAYDNGWTGIIVNGAIRDVVELREVPIGIFALATCPRKSIKRGIGTRGESMRFVDAEVHPGDIAAADPDGVIVIAADEFTGI